MEFNAAEIEHKWKEWWVKNNTYQVNEDTTKPKYYVLDMFPYPSGAGLHVGHPLGYVASDIFARYKKMKGFNVLHPMGFDAFGLPAEQYAIETGTHPQITTEKAIAYFKEQLDKIGFNYDWSRSFKTSDPAYYKWTQWIFEQLFNSYFDKKTNKAADISDLIKEFETNGSATILAEYEKNHVAFSATEWAAFSESQRQQILMQYRLVFLSYSEVNWCEALGTVLANDEIKDGKSERGGHPIERKKMRQWFLRITDYADRLLDGLTTLDWSDAMKEMQRNWIGKSAGALIDFPIAESSEKLKVFTTRPDTIFGVTFMVIAAEHELTESLTTAAQKTEVDAYISYVKGRTDVERQQEKKVTGVFTGSYAVNPFNGVKIPIYIAEYVLSGYGTGAIMAVPADDERDRKFAEKFGLDIIEVIDKSAYPGATIEDKIGKMINSDFLTGMEVPDAIETMFIKIKAMGIGSKKINYRLRDAGFSRQRYWGEPFPVQYQVVGQPDHTLVTDAHQEHDDYPVLLPENKLPLKLPEVSSFKPTGDGRSPLANNQEWVADHYETDTMPGYAGSSWYFFRYMDAKNATAFAGKDKLDYWQNVDLYIGGTEHAVGHLLYSRMWTKFLFDLGYLPVDEPFQRLVNQGMIGGQSALICRLTSEIGERKPIYISYSLLKNFELPPFKVGVLNQFLSQDIIDLIKAQAGDVGDDFYSSIYFDSFHIDVNCLEGDNLSIDKLIEWKDEYKEQIFIKDENDKFTCLREFEKMSKRWYNVVNPDDVIAEYGADCFRMFLMFLGPLEQAKPWDNKGIDGVHKFLRRFWRLFFDENNQLKLSNEAATAAEQKVLHKTIKKIGEDIEKLSYNTCVSTFMIAVNELADLKCNKRTILEPMVRLIAPFAPFLSEEIWHQLGNAGSIHHTDFPVYDAQYLVESSFAYPISVNGKVRANIEISLDTDEASIKKIVLDNEAIRKWTEDKPLKKFVFVKGRIINVVI